MASNMVMMHINKREDIYNFKETFKKKDKKELKKYIEWLMPKGSKIKVKFSKDDDFFASYDEYEDKHGSEHIFSFYCGETPRSVVWHEVGHYYSYGEYEASMWGVNKAMERGYYKLVEEMYYLYCSCAYRLELKGKDYYYYYQLPQFKRLCRDIKKRLRNETGRI